MKVIKWQSYKTIIIDFENLKEEIEKIANDLPQPNEDKIFKYLREGALASGSFGPYFTDPFNPKGLLDPNDNFTDGHWLWDSALAYLVKCYHVTLPKEFIDHMRKNKWSTKIEKTWDINIKKAMEDFIRERKKGKKPDPLAYKMHPSWYRKEDERWEKLTKKKSWVKPSQKKN